MEIMMFQYPTPSTNCTNWEGESREPREKRGSILVPVGCLVIEYYKDIASGVYRNLPLEPRPCSAHFKETLRFDFLSKKQVSAYTSSLRKQNDFLV
jgi:hypothetical protein